MNVTIPTVDVDPAGIQAAAGELPYTSAAFARQADALVRSWTGLGAVYHAFETNVLLHALDPVRASAHKHQARLNCAADALAAFADVAQAIIAQLDALRAQAVTPQTAGLIEEQAASLIQELHDAEQTCADAIRAGFDQPDPSVAQIINNHINSDFARSALLWGDFLKGDHLLDSPFEGKLVRHFTDGSGEDYVFTDEELAQLGADPAVRQVSAAIASQQLHDGSTLLVGGAKNPSTVRAVTLEGGLRGYVVDVDFKQPAPGRDGNEFDGSLGRAKVFYDAAGNFVGVSDIYDFSNAGPSVDQVNLIGGTFGSKPFHVRGGVIQELPPDELSVVPDQGTAAQRLLDRLRGIDPGPNIPTGR